MTQEQTIGKTKVEVKTGNILFEPSDGLITAINSHEMWYGGIDKAIRSVAGEHFHGQAENKQLKNLETVFAVGHNDEKRPAFKNVIFVVDDLKSPLHKVVEAGLKSATEAGLKKITIPGIRLGAALGGFEKTIDEVYAELEKGVRIFLENNVTSIENITFVMRD